MTPHVSHAVPSLGHTHNPCQSVICSLSLHFCLFKNALQIESYSMSHLRLPSLNRQNVFEIHPTCVQQQVVPCPGLMSHSLFIQSPMEEDLGAFLLLAIANKGAINICAQVFVWLYVFTSLWEIPRIGTAVSYGNNTFNILIAKPFSRVPIQFGIPPPSMCECPHPPAPSSACCTVVPQSRLLLAFP